jgi:hypothetical protein
VTEKKPTKKALLEAFRAEMGRCSEMIEETRECPHWGIEKVNDRAYCGQHVRAVFLAADAARREAARRAEVDGRIDAYLAWTAVHPSVHDAMPRKAECE